MKKAQNKKYNYSALTARHFNFEVKEVLNVEKEAIKLAKACKKESKYFDPYLPPIEELTQILLNYKEFEKEHGPVPQMLYFDQPAIGDHTKHRKRAGENMISLNILGVEDSIAESIMIKTISIILKENGYKNYTLHLNNIGSKESKTMFNRESTAFFRKNINLLNANCRQMFKKSVHTLITEGGDQCKVLKEHAPEPMDFLDEETRDNFSKLIERIETYNIPYEINPEILGDQNYSNYTNFQFVDENGKVIAAASRFNLLSKKIGIRKDVPSITANIWIKPTKTVSEISIKKIDSNKNFILQLGEQAKTFTLKVLEDMWSKKVHSKHNLIKDRLTPQIQESKRVKAENIIIIGQKESNDFNVMIRDAGGRSQKIMSVEELIEYLKNYK